MHILAMHHEVLCIMACVTLCDRYLQIEKCDNTTPKLVKICVQYSLNCYYDALFITLCYKYTKFSQIQTYFEDYLPFLDGNQHIQ